jgi:hypothetical protein
MSIGFNTRIFGRAAWQQPVKRSRNSDADSQKRKVWVILGLCRLP